MSKIKVLLVDDHQGLREGLQTLLELDADILVVATAGTAMDGLKRAREVTVEVALIDHQLPDHDGVWLLKQLKEVQPEMAVVMLSMHSDEFVVVKALESGADGYLTKTAEPAEMVNAIKAVREGRIYVQGTVAPHLFRQRHLKSGPLPEQELRLDDREREILNLAASERSNQGIAEELGVPVSSVKAHLRSIFGKLDAFTRAEAIQEAVRRGELYYPGEN